MGDLNRLRAAIAAAVRGDGGPPGPATAVAMIAARALPGDGAAVTLMSSDAKRETLAATDEVIAAVERAQYVVGEGPSLDALTAARPVLTPDLDDAVCQAAWPGLCDLLAGLPARALFAFPMRVGAAMVGVALCYRRISGPLDRDDVVFALRAADLLTLALLRMRHTTTATDDQSDWLGDGVPGVRAVHQATGMVMVQLGGVTADLAFARLRGYAYAHDRTLEDVSADIVGRLLVLQPDDPALS